jgi:ribonuclease-3
LAALERQLGYRFKDRKLLSCALTHASVRSDRSALADNERLEFLGDRVLGLTVSAMIYETFPSATEGEMARRFNRLVRREACADVARSLNLGDVLILSESEAENGGRQKETIIADAMEAVLGAIFLEAGYEQANDTVRALWGAQLMALPQIAADPKSALQEWAQGQGLPLPQYIEMSRTGPDHAPVFVSEVRIQGREPARGEGSSKRAAEKAAAGALLLREGVLHKSASV